MTKQKKDLKSIKSVNSEDIINDLKNMDENVQKMINKKKKK